MLKLFYTLLTDPLGLPIGALWEYIILLILGEIVHKIAQKASTGGTFGSLIYWVTKIIVYVMIWAVIYIVIVVIKFIISHGIWFAAGGGALVAATTVLLIYSKVSNRTFK